MMFEELNIHQQLLKQKVKTEKVGENLLTEAHRILNEDLFTEKKILENLGVYNRSYEVLDEELLDENQLFTIQQIKQVCIRYRLKCLDSKHYKPDIPFETLARIKYLNEWHKKEIKHFKILTTHAAFSNNTFEEVHLFAKTNNDNYFLVHSWGHKLKWIRKLKYWPLRHFEHLIVTVAAVTLLITICLPTGFISLDENIAYFSGFRFAAFFHLFIFNMGVTVYIAFAFTKNFSSSVWNQVRDFD